uniref:C-type lectin domain-containing protein n=1 Tax=Ascaris lumbricoides TaxID=6252 RepID=A0A0M3I839_ASCLU
MKLRAYFLKRAIIEIRDVVSASRCENKWSFSPHSENCYFIVDEPIGWNVAEADCQWKMAHVMSIHSEAENTFVAALALKLGKPIWIGAALFGNSHTYEYADFSNFDYTNWINGTQPEYNKGRKCIKMHPSNGTWFTDCCFKRPVPYLCQKPSGYFETPKATVPENTKPRNTSATSDTMAENLRPISMLKNPFRNASTEKVAAKNTKAIKRTKSVSSNHRQEHSKFIDHTIDSQKTDTHKKGKQTLKKAEQKPASSVNWQKNMLKATKRHLGTG